MTTPYFQGTEPYNLVVDVTPALASDWLAQCNSHNRAIVDAHVDRLMREMQAGRWRLTHQGIAFSPNRVLLDGQHRLWAVVLAETTVPMRVFFNAAAVALGAIDSTRPRTNDEIITLAGGMNVVTKLELATLRAMLAGLGSYTRMTAGEEAEWLGCFRAGVQFALEVLPSARYHGVATAATRGVLARAYYRCDHGKLRHFADVLQRGVATGEEDQPAVLLVQFLMESAVYQRRGRPEFRERYGKTERALSAYLNGERLQKLYMVTSELYPLPSRQLKLAAG